MKSLQRLLLILSLCLFAGQAAAGPKLVKIRLTGTCEEDIEMTVGNRGRTEVISSLPYDFQVGKDELPLRLTFRSEHYVYYTIDVPAKPVDDLGHVYLVKPKEETTPESNTNRESLSGQQETFKVKGIDLSQGVNKAPYTGLKAEKTYALIIANEDYEMATGVKMARNDGLAVKEYFIKTLGLAEKQVLYYPNATFGKMRKAMNDIKGIASAYGGDINLLIYYAGHGIPDNATKDAYLMPVDVDGTDVSVCYSLKKFYSDIEDMHVRQAVVFLDACFSGAKRDGDMIVAARGVAIKAKEERPKGNTFVFCATSDEEAAYSYEEEKHGLFTYYLLKYMQEKKGNVNLGGLSDYIRENVSRQSVLINGKKQTPTIVIPETADDSWRKSKLTLK